LGRSPAKFLDRAEPDAVGLAEGAVNGASFGNAHLGAVDKGRDVGGVGVVPDEIPPAFSLSPEERALQIVSARPDIDQLICCDSEGEAPSQKSNSEIYSSFKHRPSEIFKLGSSHGAKSKEV